MVRPRRQPLSERFAREGWIALVRHGRTRAVEGAAAHTWALAADGERAVAELGERLRDIYSAPVICSPEPKAIRTAELLRPAASVRVDEDLREHGLGQIPYLSSEEFNERIARFFALPDEPIFGPETLRQAAHRMSRAIGRVARGPAILVSHGRIIGSYVSVVMGANGLAFWKELQMPDVVFVKPDTAQWARLP